MYAKFFIHRPILSSVISIIIVLCGLVAIFNMPLARYPNITPPTIYISTSYPAAGAETSARTVASQLEAQLNSVPNLLYMSSNSSNGGVWMALTFEVGTNLDHAINDVLNRVRAATALLPGIVQQQGVSVTKNSPNYMMNFYFYNDGSGNFDQQYMGNFLKRTLANDLKLVPGVGRVGIYANTYAIRVWMNVNAMNSLHITPTDISNAIKEQNQQYRIGSNSYVLGSPLTFNITGSSMYATPKQFENIIIRASKTQIIRLKDVARVELGTENYGVKTYAGFLNKGKFVNNQVVFMQIFADPAANQLKVKKLVMQKLKEASARFPTGLKYKVSYDATQFVATSINNVEKTLFEACILVGLVVFLFLQNIRASIIAIITVPVSIIGSFAFLNLFGFSINTLDLFAMILAIGIVVDDAIIVVENIERIKEKTTNILEQIQVPHACVPWTHACGRRQATSLTNSQRGADASGTWQQTWGLNLKEYRNIKAVVEIAMHEVFGALIAIALVLSVVFIPVMFLPGLSGVLYRQFAITIACTMLISAITALTTVPAVSCLLLKKKISPGKFAVRFYQIFDTLTKYYVCFAGKLIDWGKWVLLILIISILLLSGIFKLVPSSFIPNEDQGFLVGSIELPSGSSREDSQKIVGQITGTILKHRGVAQVVYILGTSVLSGSTSSYSASIFVSLKKWQFRTNPKENVRHIVNFINSLNKRYRDVNISAFNLPPIFGLGSTGGVQFYLEARTSDNLKLLAQKTKLLESALMQHKAIKKADNFFDTNSEQVMLTPDVDKARFYGVKVNDIYNLLQAIYGTSNVNYAYIMQALVWVILQGEYGSRKTVRGTSNIYVKNTKGELVPINNLLKKTFYKNPGTLNRFNGYTAINVIVTPNKGYTSGDTMNIIQHEMQNVANGYDYEWVGTSYMQIQSQKISIIAFVLAFIMIYLVLCALYEMWRLPLVVLMGVPFALLGSGLILLARHQPNDLYFQISLVTLLGLSAKNIILLIEFALKELNRGLDAKDAVLKALKIRFRPIVMTSITFIVGALPLAFATGAGANAEHSVGTGIIGGMLGSVVLGTLVTPSLFVLIMKNYKK